MVAARIEHGRGSGNVRDRRYHYVRGVRLHAAHTALDAASGGSMLPTQPRHDDIIIRRRFGEHPLTHMVKQIYASPRGIPTRAQNTRIMAKPRRWRSG